MFFSFHSVVLAIASAMLLAACSNGIFQSSGGGSNPDPIVAGFPNSTVLAIAVNSANGDVYVGGQFTSIGSFDSPYIARYLSSGHLDANFVRGSGFNGQVLSLLLTNDQLYVGGSFTNYNGGGGSGVTRLTLDGALDTAYNPSASNFNSDVLSIKPSRGPSNRLLVVGAFTTYAGIQNLRALRLHTDGALDTGYGPVGVGFDGTVRDIAQGGQAPFPIIAVGDFNSYDSVPFDYITFLQTNGQIDPGFSTVNQFDAQANAVEWFQNDVFFVVGNFDDFNSASTIKIAGITASGGNAVPFASGPNATVRSLAVSTGGNLYIGGDFTNLNTDVPQYAAAVNTNGFIVGNFLTNVGFNLPVEAAAATSDQKAYFGGQFTTFGTFPVAHFARLGTDGKLDSTFPLQP
ncbi:MAG: delta-60 repeat domain-containing protein [Bdellovibrionota bacterium]